jgi:hypothetical protein
MGLFDWFRRRPATPEQQKRIAYDIAYLILPELIFRDRAEFDRMTNSLGAAAGRFLYAIVCRRTRIAFDRDVAKQYAAQTEWLAEGVRCFVLAFPVPPPLIDVDSGVVNSVTLAPHFCAVVERRNVEPRYFVLGQSFGRSTTLREVTAGMNCNLGPGPEPLLTEFLDAVRGQLRNAG